MSRLRLGTRRSDLAVTQSTWVADRLRALGHEVEIVEIVTEGDVDRSPLTQIGGTGVFAAAIRTALTQGRIDVAVHSLKDLPVTPEPGLVVAAVPPRETPADALVADGGGGIADLPAGAVVGTGSPRRSAQLAAARPDLRVRPLRGNVGTRLAKVGAELDAVVLAAAGLTRLGLLEECGAAVLPPEVMLPAPGQGALAVECRSDDAQTLAATAPLEDAITRLTVTAERALLAALEAGCTAPVGALARVVTREEAEGLGAEVSAPSRPRDAPPDRPGPHDPADPAEHLLVLDAFAGSDDASISLRRRGIIGLPPDVVQDAEESTPRLQTGSGADALAAATHLGRDVAARLLAAGADRIPATMRLRDAPAPDLAPPEAAPPAATDTTNEQE